MGWVFFGARVLTGWNWAEQFTFQYLVLWYGAGFLFAALFFLRDRFRFNGREVTIAGFMGAASVGGQLTLLAALQRGIPRYVMFPLANGGGLFLVALAGILLFGERIHLYGTAGIVLGIAATLLLSLP